MVDKGKLTVYFFTEEDAEKFIDILKKDWDETVYFATDGFYISKEGRPFEQKGNTVIVDGEIPWVLENYTEFFKEIKNMAAGIKLKNIIIKFGIFEHCWK